MQQRGRQPARLLEFPHVEGTPPEKLIPPAALSRQERAIFDEVAALAPHLSAIDVPILASFAQAVLLARKLIHSDVDRWAKVVGCQVQLGRALRLVANSRSHPITVARRVRDTAAKTETRLWE